MKKTVFALLIILSTLLGYVCGANSNGLKVENLLNLHLGWQDGADHKAVADNEKGGDKTQKVAEASPIAVRSIPALEADAPALIKQYEGDYSLYVYVPKTGAEYVYNSKPMPSASMIKMYILGLAYKEIQAGLLKEEDIIVLQEDDKVGGAGNIQGYANGTELSIKKLLREMIVESDNVATNLMIRRLGMNNINEYIRDQGYTDTVLQRSMMDFKAVQNGKENYTSVKDLGRIFARIHAGECVSPDFDARMVATLKDQTDNDKIPKGLPSDAVFAHKTGELVGVYNDGGIVYSDHGDYIIVVMTNHVGGSAIENIGALSRLVWKGLQKSAS